MNQMLGAWKETPDASNDIPSALKSLSSPKEDASNERYLSESRNSCTGWLLPSPNAAATHFPQPWAHLQLTLPIPNTLLPSPMPPVSKSTNPCLSLSLATRSLFNVSRAWPSVAPLTLFFILSRRHAHHLHPSISLIPTQLSNHTHFLFHILTEPIVIPSSLAHFHMYPP